MIETTYAKYLNLILKEKEKRKMTIKRLGEHVGINSATMSKYLYQGVPMPADVMFSCLIVFGYKIEVIGNA